MLSLIAIFLPLSRPCPPAWIFVFQYQAPYGLSDAEGRYPGDRGAIGAKAGGTNSSSLPYEANGPLKACCKAPTSPAVRTSHKPHNPPQPRKKDKNKIKVSVLEQRWEGKRPCFPPRFCFER